MAALIPEAIEIIGEILGIGAEGAAAAGAAEGAGMLGSWGALAAELAAEGEVVAEITQIGEELQGIVNTVARVASDVAAEGADVEALIGDLAKVGDQLERIDVELEGMVARLSGEQLRLVQAAYNGFRDAGTELSRVITGFEDFLDGLTAARTALTEAAGDVAEAVIDEMRAVREVAVELSSDLREDERAFADAFERISDIIRRADDIIHPHGSGGHAAVDAVPAAGRIRAPRHRRERAAASATRRRELEHAVAQEAAQMTK